MINKHPGTIIKCIDAADVITAVNFAKENKLLLAIRGGGLNGGGLGSCDGGMVIDLLENKFVCVIAEDNTVNVGAGNLWREVDHATHPFGLAISSGIISTTGVAGLTLGGGVGYLARKCGLTIDSLLEVDMVMADGTYLTVNNHQYPDLFWAIRGGGGNFGIITSFKFQGHPLKTVYGGPTLWPIEQVEEIMEWYDAFIENAEEDLNGFIATMIIPRPHFPDFLHNKKFCGIIWCYLGDPKNAKEVFKPIKELKPIFEHLGEMPFPALQTIFDGMMPPGLQW
ncbi:FAD-binding oxidoreductase [Gillisia sp. JM1]|uniref:FAD-binding oxidoreductase n=1 Tax=Gillisia sp. JM1 TaxID=1283286 RepID=UPI0004035B9B|nr:FAD-binding oxidoreductase [Gillisia sp. JM1]